jgi:hypothetical protein
MRKYKKLQFMVVGLAALAASGSARAGIYTYFDGTFNPTDWTAIPFAVAVAYDAAHGLTFGSYSLSQVSSGGNPGYFQQLAISSDSGWTGVDVVGPFSYSPAALGAISSLTIGYSRETLVYNQTNLLEIRQGSNTFTLPSADWQTGTTTGWSNTSFTTTASDWSNRDGSGTHPDFSSAGGPITFGWYGADTSVSGTAGVDNFSVSVDSIPKPATLALLSFGLTSLAVLRRRRRSA